MKMPAMALYFDERANRRGVVVADHDVASDAFQDGWLKGEDLLTREKFDGAVCVSAAVTAALGLLRAGLALALAMSSPPAA